MMRYEIRVERDFADAWGLSVFCGGKRVHHTVGLSERNITRRQKIVKGHCVVWWRRLRKLDVPGRKTAEAYVKVIERKSREDKLRERNDALQARIRELEAATGVGRV